MTDEQDKLIAPSEIRAGMLLERATSEVYHPDGSPNRGMFYPMLVLDIPRKQVIRGSANLMPVVIIKEDDMINIDDVFVDQQDDRFWIISRGKQ